MKEPLKDEVKTEGRNKGTGVRNAQKQMADNEGVAQGWGGTGSLEKLAND